MKGILLRIDVSQSPPSDVLAAAMPVVESLRRQAGYKELALERTTFNGYANQYVTHPLTAKPGERVRLWVVAVGPTLDTDFHVVGTIFDRAWPNANVTGTPQHGVQTLQVPAGGGGVFDVKIDEPGLYPFVSHAFAHVDLGQVGLLKIGHPPGTMSH